MKTTQPFVSFLFQAALLLLVAGFLENLTFGADALKPRPSVKKPKIAAIDRFAHLPDRVSVKFIDDSKVRLREGKLVDFGTGALDQAVALLHHLEASGAKWEREHHVSEELLDDLREKGQKNTGKTMPDLNTAFVLRLPAKLDPKDVLNELNALEVVEIALAMPRPAAPPVVPNFEPQQGYLNPATATNGVNAKYAWTFPGGNGADVRVVDIEFNWNLNHRDLSAFLIGPAPVVPVAQSTNHHGTAVLGVMGGLSDGVGVTGIAWGSTFFVAAVSTGPNTNYNMAAAITTALSRLRPGDIIVLEQQIDGPGMATNDWAPAEWFKPTYEAIVMAVANEVIVCEAAGNGTNNLDSAIFNTGHKPFLPENDSGAILIGAGAAAGPTNRSRLEFSNYGSAVDLQGWGEMVVTTGYGDLDSADGTNALYAGAFSGTSSATPIVAGAIAALQGAHRARFGGAVIGPLEMRALFQATGFAQTGIREHIGPLPNLEDAIPLAFASRVWVDFAFTGNPEGGTIRFPVKTLPLAFSAVPAFGAVVMKGGTTPWTGTISKPMTLNSYLGGATIGR